MMKGLEQWPLRFPLALQFYESFGPRLEDHEIVLLFFPRPYLGSVSFCCTPWRNQSHLSVTFRLWWAVAQGLCRLTTVQRKADWLTGTLPTHWSLFQRWLPQSVVLWVESCHRGQAFPSFWHLVPLPSPKPPWPGRAEAENPMELPDLFFPLGFPSIWSKDFSDKGSKFPYVTIWKFPNSPYLCCVYFGRSTRCPQINGGLLKGVLKRLQNWITVKVKLPACFYF